MNRKENIKQIKNSKGITLVALVVTIIVLIILAGVSINLVFGDNGIITNALNAKDKYSEAKVKEYEALIAYEEPWFFTDDKNFQNVNDINYIDTKQSISNPDRGFYIPVVLEINSEGNINYSSLQSRITTAKNNDFSLIHLRIDIGQLSGNVNGIKDQDFSEKQLQDLNSIFDLIRSNRIKAIVRFAYDFKGIQGREPSDFNTIENHIKQLSSVFEVNKDVISVVEAGIIGIYGEMHSSIYAKDEFYKRLIEVYLENIPENMKINVRTPKQYAAKFGNITPNKNEVSTNKEEFRVGIFNDGYLASSTDLGTFSDRNEFIKFMQSHGTYTMYGGEVTKANGIDDSLSDIEKCSLEMPQTHTSYLNYEFNQQIIQSKWTTQIYDNDNSEYDGTIALKYIQDHLGYRLVLRNSSISKDVKQGDVCGVRLEIENTGFANVINDQTLSIILQKDSKCYETQTNININNVLNGQINKVNFGFLVPSDIETGEWNIYLKIASSYNSEYTIKFANPNVYNELYDANYVGKVSIEENSQALKGIEFKQAFDVDSTKGTYSDEIIEIEELDGKNTAMVEYDVSNLTYNSGDSKVYTKIQSGYLYFYIESPNIQNYKHSRIRFTNRFSSNEKNYAYVIEDFYHLCSGSLQVLDSNANHLIIEQKTKDGIECRINLSYLEEINSISNLFGIRFELLDSSWSAIEIMEYANLEGVYSLIDGKRTSEYEWNNSNIVIDDGNSGKIYIKNDDKYLYIYCEDEVVKQTVNVHFRIAKNTQITNPMMFKNYEYCISNKILYETDSNGYADGNKAIETLQYSKDEGIEYRITLTSLGITNVDEITSVQTYLMDSGWSVLKSISGLIN